MKVRKILLKKKDQNRIIEELPHYNRYSYYQFFLLIIIGLNLGGCAFFKPHQVVLDPYYSHKNEPLKYLGLHLGSICLTGEGRGKIQDDLESNSFNFESKWDAPAKKWSLALSLPLQGEKVIQILWKDVLNGKVQLSGPAFDGILKDEKEGHGKIDPQMVARFLQGIGVFFNFYERIVNNERPITTSKIEGCLSGDMFQKQKEAGRVGGECEYKIRNGAHLELDRLSWIMAEDAFFINQDLWTSKLGHFYFNVNASKFDNKYYKKIQFVLTENSEYPLLSSPKSLTLELYTTLCASKP